MTITRQEVLHVARLARLEVSEEAADAMARELDGILGYVKKLDELDTSGVEPTLQVSVGAAPLREDRVEEGVARETALREAPRTSDAGFLVPGFVDES